MILLPHCLQNRCFATQVLKVYVASLSASVNSLNRLVGTIKMQKPKFEQIEQLHLLPQARSSGFDFKLTAPQWQLPW